jgi:hypothetical protein
VNQEGKHVLATGRGQRDMGEGTYNIEKRVTASGDGSYQLGIQCTVFLLFEALRAA